MSTGLTWVSCNDLSNSLPSANYSQSFSDYNEAVDFALYNSKLLYAALSSGTNELIWIIYTKSPNQNGYVYLAAAPVFTSFD